MRSLISFLLMVVLIFRRFSAACLRPASTAATFLLLATRSIFSTVPRTLTLGVQASSFARIEIIERGQGIPYTMWKFHDFSIIQV